MTTRIRPLLLATAAVVTTLTVVIAVVPQITFAYRGESAHIAIETSATLVSLLAAFILLGRVQHTSQRSELLLFTGLLLLFAGNLARSLAPSFTGGNEIVVWGPLSINLAAGAVLAWAAVAPDDEIDRRRSLRLVAVLLAAAGIAIAAVYGLADRLPTGIDPGIRPRESDSVIVTGNAGLLGAQLASMALFAVAAAGFGVRARRTGDEFLAWLAIGMVLAAITRLNYFLFPSIYSDWVFSGDILRFATYLAILIGALRQIAAYQRAAARAAVIEERGRIAEDLHDGLAQDLAFIAMQSESLARDDERAAELVEAARHALSESRGAIENLRLTDAPLAPALENVAKALAGRHRTRLDLDLDRSVETTPQVRDQLLRIAGEAISNAIRHGDPGEVRVRLASDGGRTRLIVADDGRGFDTEADEGDADGWGGLGLPGMRRRVDRLGGSFRVRSRPGGGTRVEVLIP